MDIMMSTPEPANHEPATIDGIDRQIVSPERWQTYHDAIRAREKELTRTHDQLAAERRRAPWAKVEQDYRFKGSDGAATLVDLFHGRKPQTEPYHWWRRHDEYENASEHAK